MSSADDRIDKLERQVAALRLVPRLLEELETRPEIAGLLAAVSPWYVLHIVSTFADAWGEGDGDLDEAVAKLTGEVKAKLKIVTVDGVPVGDQRA
jgi:hypothetical protein